MNSLQNKKIPDLLISSRTGTTQQTAKDFSATMKS